MASYDSFVFEGHGYSEATGGYDPGATNGSVRENDLADKINKAAKKYLDTTSLKIHYDENNYTDKDLAGNTYSKHCGAVTHINSSIGASGVEVIVPINEKYLVYDFELAKGISELLGIPNRNVKSRDYDSEGFVQRLDGVPYGGSDYYGEIRDAWSRGISLAIIEVGFIQNDLAKIQANIDGIGFLIAKYIANNCGVDLKKPAPPKPTTPPPTKPSTEVKYKVIAGGFNDRANAEKRVKELKDKGFDSFILKV